jgi:hypothetical protein
VNWKTNIQILDLAPDDRLELTCRLCKTTRWLSGSECKARKGLGHLTLSDVERRARCKKRGCFGTMRLAMPSAQDTVGFVGGIA